MQRRQERDEALGIVDEETTNKMNEALVKKKDDEKYLPFLIAKKSKKKNVSQKVLDIERKAHGRMMLTLANYNDSNRNFLGRMEQQYSVAKTLDTLSKDLGEFVRCSLCSPRRTDPLVIRSVLHWKGEGENRLD